MCADIDECSLGLDSCVENADCTDTEGSYTCMCSSGYTGDGLSSCTGKLNAIQCYSPLLDQMLFSDIDECDLGTDMCHQQATCTDTDGSYSCTCNSGYTGNGLECNGKHTGSSMDIQ